MDAARLGHAGPLPAALLLDAAAGYLTGPPPAGGAEKNAAGHDDAATSSRADALAWAGAEFDGAVRALEPVPTATGTDPAGYRVTGCLEQHGLRTRQDRLGPASLWDALVARAADAGTADTSTADTSTADISTADISTGDISTGDTSTGDTGTGDLIRVGQAARDRGLYRHAAALWTAAAGAGSADAAGRLVAHLREVSPGEVRRAARWAADRVRLDDPWDLARLLEELHAAGDPVQVLLDRDPAGEVSLGPDRRRGVARLLTALRTAGAADAARALAARAADAGMFGLVWDRAGFPFGREPDGAPSPPWAWATF